MSDSSSNAVPIAIGVVVAGLLVVVIIVLLVFYRSVYLIHLDANDA
jgi:hypothetical protein